MSRRRRDTNCARLAILGLYLASGQLGFLAGANEGGRRMATLPVNGFDQMCGPIAGFQIVGPRPLTKVQSAPKMADLE